MNKEIKIAIKRKKKYSDRPILGLFIDNLIKDSHYKTLNKYVDKIKIKDIKGINEILQKNEAFFPETLFKFNKKGEITQGIIPKKGKVVIKTNVGSAGATVLNSRDITKKYLKKFYRKNQKYQKFYKYYGEIQYCNTDYVCYGEEFLGFDPTDYKIHVFKDWYSLQIYSDRSSSKKIFGYDFDLNIRESQDYKKPKKYKTPEFESLKISRETIHRMNKIASEIQDKLAEYVRVDFYGVDNKIYLGELTFTTDAGQVYFEGNGSLVKKFTESYLNSNKKTD